MAESNFERGTHWRYVSLVVTRIRTGKSSMSSAIHMSGVTSSKHPDLFTDLADVLRDYADKRITGKVVNHEDYATLKHKLQSLDVRAGNQSWKDVWATVETYLDYSVKTAHPQYFNQLWAGQSEPALVGSVIEAIANTSMYTYEVAPVATVIENDMLNVFRQAFGFHTGEAQVTSGGSNSNYLVGLDSLFKVATDDRGVMKTDELEKQIKACIDEGRVPVSIIGTAGTTVRGAYDDFNALADVARKHDCWLHIDGAWGGAVALSSSVKHLLDGIDKADSMTWDAHKMLGVPLMCGILFTRESGHFDRVCNLGDTSYIFHDSDDRQDLGPYSLQCGRRVDMLKMWLEYVFYGETGFQNRIDHFMHLSGIAEQRILEEPTLELQSVRWINNICFRSTIDGVNDKNRFNKAVRERLHKQGKSFVNIAYLGDELTVRLIITNKDVTEKDIHEFFDNWLTVAAEIGEEMRQCA